VQMYQFPVATPLGAALGTRHFVMPMEFLTVDEVHATETTGPVLSNRQFHIPGGEVALIDFPPFPPVLPQVGVVWRGCALHQLMPDDLEPAKLEQVAARAFVTKHPVVAPSRVQLAPVLLISPLPTLVGVGVFGVALRAAAHPVVHLAEHLGRYHRAI